jgi:hypothetical protein
MPRYKKSLCKQPASSGIKVVIWTISAHTTMQLSQAMKLPGFSTDITERAEVPFIMLSWSRPTKVFVIVRKALNFTNIINEVTVWNNDVNSFPSDNLPKSNQVVIRIVDSERNIIDRAKYEACQLDTNSLCLYTDDNYDIFTILKASIRQIFETQH